MSRASRFRGCGRALLLAAATWGCHASELPVRLAPSGVLIDGEAVAGDRDAIGRAFRAHANERRPLVIRLEPGADEARLADVLEHAKATGVFEATLETQHSKQHLLLQTQRGTPQRLVIRAFHDRADVWLISPPPDGYRDLGEWRIGDSPSEVAISELVARACPGPCAVSFQMTAGSVVSTLEAWHRLAPSQRRMELRVFAPGPAPAVTPTHTVSGFLPPELIQAVMRAQFERFRECYEQGLSKNAQLGGTVSARFVIGLDGRTSHVTDGGSSLPDVGVRDCVLRHVETLTFPAPLGGIVAVIYPILLAPG